MRTHRVLLLLAGAAITLSTSAAAQVSSTFDSATIAAFRWRSIGPAVMAGRITDIEADPRNSKTFYVAAATGGIWKTINNGTMFFPVFDKEAVISMGDIAIAPSNGDIIYAGTGEEDSRNSMSPGGGLYKSTDAGKTWKLMGLIATQQIGRIVVDPQDPNVVYVSALGHAWESNPERGLYKTTDGGATWKLSKFISDKAGFVDIAMDPKDHNTLFASSWERVRGPYFLKSGGPGSGLWKTADAGATWTEVKGGGFPATPKGRIGIAIAPSDSKMIYALVEADTLAKALPKGMKPDTAKAQRTNSGLYRSTDGGATWALMRRNEGDARPFYYSQVRVDPRNPNRVYWMSSVWRFSDDGGKTERRGALSLHTDWHAMWIDPKDPDHFILGEDGGIGVTWDKGGTYDFINTIPLGQFYAVSYDMARPYNVCGGLQDNGSWCGPSRTRGRFGPTNADWQNVGGGDGFYTAQDPNDPNIVYSESQGGNASRLNLQTNARTSIMRGGGGGPGRGNFEDSLIIARGDTTLPATPQLNSTLAAIRARAAVDSARRYRFNWSTPFFLSPHSPTTVYMGGNRVLKSSDRGDHFYPISPDLSTADSARIKVSTKTTGGITRDATGAETYGTITTLAESPIRPGILWAGTDDGNVWLSTNDGGSWTELTKRFPGVPPKTWVNRVEPSHFDTATVYVAFDAHRDNNFKPYLYVSNDFGRTFHSIVNNLPSGGIGYVHVVREDPYNRSLLFVGTDVGAYVSRNTGGTWQRFMTGLPTVPVHDLKIHPRDRDLIAATHGRSIWITDIAPLEQMADSVIAKPAYFFEPVTAYEYATGFSQRWEGNKAFVADNPPFGGTVAYRLTSGDSRRDTTRIVITDVKGDVVRRLTGPGGAGIHRVVWDLRGLPRPLGPSALRDSIAAARLRRLREDSLRAAGVDTTLTGRPLPPGADTAAMRAMRDSMTAMRQRGDSAGMRALREKMTEQFGGRGVRGGGPGGLGGRGGAAPGEINLRPAEAPLGAGAFGAGGGGGGGGGFGGGRQAAMVPEGDYLVTITANGQTMRRVLHVERVSDIPQDSFGGDDDDDGHER
jgi:Sortilin, neurotensin receptor 3,